MRDWRPGPDVPRAHHFDAAFCGDPKCGVHLVAYNRDGSAICEIVMSAAQTLAMVEVCKGGLYDKATQREEP
jgi:hypothetical protein